MSDQVVALDRLAAERFQDLAQQKHAATLGMWIFLVSEMLLFGGLFTLYAAYRALHPHAFAAGATATDLVLGTANTYVLLTASFLVAAALHSVRHDHHRSAWRLLASAAVLGVVFLALKGLEYAHHFASGAFPGAWNRDPKLASAGGDAFWALYYLMTGLHALHVIGGIAILSLLAFWTRRRLYGPAYDTPVELGGMYWHFVDVVWLFLWPMFYLLR